MSRPTRLHPRELAAGWPDVVSVDPIGEVARQFALNVRAAIGDRSIRAAAQDVGVDHSTIVAVLQGRTWPDLATIARLELGFGVDLWPGRIGSVK
ncbi:helix-turn-helix domain-containing protein [Cryobacterium roopkundense]|uniref:Transcriptional regulator with XRE-family HTH domain n=1 Tax=Cryobacterium roopkundense TaxID=1001240 RepID=A0A7W8ZZW6_9MICO|nr:helix-turn-helix transcriptional regulator [Cryobacterium roopkundense]MBB5643055.1 transcriptional regulator with XRE-family HTH domain [Cryobacterium roopkundense]